MSAISSSERSWPVATSRTTTGTRSRPASCAARQRRSPAMISKAIADLADDDRLDDAVGRDRAAPAPRAASSSTCARGWKSFGDRRSMSTSSAVGARRGSRRVGNQRAQAFAERGAFSTMVAWLRSSAVSAAAAVARRALPREREIRFGAARFHVVEDRRQCRDSALRRGGRCAE